MPKYLVVNTTGGLDILEANNAQELWGTDNTLIIVIPLEDLQGWIEAHESGYIMDLGDYQQLLGSGGDSAPFSYGPIHRTKGAIK